MINCWLIKEEGERRRRYWDGAQRRHTEPSGLIPNAHAQAQRAGSNPTRVFKPYSALLTPWSILLPLSFGEGFGGEALGEGFGGEALGEGAGVRL